MLSLSRAVAVVLCLLFTHAAVAQQTIEPGSFTLPEHETAGGKVDGSSKVVVRGTFAKTTPYVLELGWLDLTPNTTYRAAYPVRGSAASLYLMVREHAIQGVRPFVGYHKMPVHQRALSASDQWQQRKITFTTRNDTTALSVAIVMMSLDGQLQVGAFTLDDVVAEARAEYAQVLAEVRTAAAARKRLVPRTLVFSRSQMKYGLERNYEHRWLDRPLLVDRAFRVSRRHVTPFPSYRRILEQVAQYGIDGLAFFPETKGRMGMFDLTDRAGVRGVRLLPEFIPTDNIEAKLALLDAAIKCNSTVRIDGKVVITSYVASALSPPQWADILAALRDKYGDSFIFLAALTDTVALRGPFVRGEPIPREKIEKAQAYLRTYLDVCDGIYFNYPAAFKNADHTFDEAFYRELFIPVFKSVLSEPAYRGKYFGLSAYHSHSNPDLSIGLLEDGTRTLRDSFEAAMDAQPDVIVLPEWDEVNENTCFRPTMCNSTTTKRIMRQYMAKITGSALAPLGDDDVALPNLVLSMRKIVTLGEPLVIELLNIPDSAESHRYTARLTLVDQTGAEVVTFEPATFDSTILREQRYEVATERYPSARVLAAVLSVRGYKGRDVRIDRGLPHAQVRATWNWDYKFVKQPLRELLRLRVAELAWSSQGGLVGKVEADEELALVEIVADGDVVYAVNRTDQLLRADRDYEMIRIEYRSARTREVDGEVVLTGADTKRLGNLKPLHQGRLLQEMADGRLLLKGPVSPHVRWTCLAVPRDKLDGAMLDVRLGDVRIAAPLREVLAKGMIAATDGNGLHVAVYPYRRQLDMPMHVDAKSVTFDVPIWPWLATEQYHLRLTSKRGRTWRSRPLMLPGSGDEALTSLRIYSGTAHGPMDVQVSADRVPAVAYDFDPSRGAVLLADAGQPFWASLGGFPDTTSGRGGGHATSLFRGVSHGYPANAKRTAPQWVEDQGQPALRFDGIGTFVHLPREALPRRCSFTVSFDIKPQVAKDQYLLVHRAHRPASLSLIIREGKLTAGYFGAGHKMHNIGAGADSSLVVPVGKWSTVVVTYDFQVMRLSVNGKEMTLAMGRPGQDIGPIVFGGFGKTDGGFDEKSGNPHWFKGLMRNLRIEHNAR